MSYQQHRIRNRGLRDRIFTEDGWRCAYCLIDLRQLPACARTMDHVVPRAAGGTNAVTNLLSACHACNSRRRDKAISAFVGTETLTRLIRDYPRVASTIVETMTGTASAAPFSSIRMVS